MFSLVMQMPGTQSVKRSVFFMISSTFAIRLSFRMFAQMALVPAAARSQSWRNFVHWLPNDQAG